MRRILVTGGSGFIGGHLMSALTTAGHHVTNYDVKPPANRLQLPLWVAGDVASAHGIKMIVDATQPEIIFHLAAHADIATADRSAFTPIVSGTRNLIDALGIVRTKCRLINTSTQLVVGSGIRPASDLDFKPDTLYGEAKAEAERELRRRNPQFEWAIVRPTNIWGPRHPSYPRTIWRYLKKGYYLHPVGGRPPQRCYGYVANIVDQYVSIMNAPAAAINGRVFYLADSTLDPAIWLDAFSMQLRGQPTRRVPKQVLAVAALGGDLLGLFGRQAPMNSQRLRRMLADQVAPFDATQAIAGPNRVAFDEGVACTVRWLRETYPDVYGHSHGSPGERAGPAH